MQMRERSEVCCIGVASFGVAAYSPHPPSPLGVQRVSSWLGWRFFAPGTLPCPLVRDMTWTPCGGFIFPFRRRLVATNCLLDIYQIRPRGRQTPSPPARQLQIKKVTQNFLQQQQQQNTIFSYLRVNRSFSSSSF